MVDAFIAVLERSDQGYRLGTQFKDFEAAAAEHDELAAGEPDLDQRDIAA